MIEYGLWNPTGNRTILVESPVEEQAQPALAAQLMAAEPTAEQTGFVTCREDAVFLRMAGGEFCGNAALSAAACWCLRHGMAVGESTVVPVLCAGNTLFAAVSCTGENAFSCTIEMPRPREITAVTFEGRSYPLVWFDGISHLICETPMERAAAEAVIRPWCRQLGADGLGLLFWDREKEAMTPLVYVPGCDTLFWESSCASGTAAIGAYAARQAGGPVRMKLRLPGGTLGIQATPAGDLRLSGTTVLEKQCSF